MNHIPVQAVVVIDKHLSETSLVGPAILTNMCQHFHMEKHQTNRAASFSLHETNSKYGCIF